MKKLILVCLLFYAAWKLSPHEPEDPSGYTVQYINPQGDTSYLLNSRPLTLKEAVEAASGYKGQAQPIVFTKRPFKVSWEK